jgi:hypothetical protein
LSLRACADRGGPWSGGGAGLSKMLMCQMLTGTARTKLSSRPRASMGNKMVMLDQFPPRSAVWEAFVPETRRPLGSAGSQQRVGAKRAVAPVDVFGDPVRASSWAALEFRSQGRRNDWSESVRRRREPCEKAPARLHSRPNHVGCCPILSAEIPASPPLPSQSPPTITKAAQAGQRSINPYNSPGNSLSGLPCTSTFARNNVMQRSRRLCAITLILQ